MTRSPSPIRLGHVATSRAAVLPVAIAMILLAIAGVTVGVAVKLLTDPFGSGPVRFWDEVVPALRLSAFVLFLTYLFGFPGYVFLAPLLEARRLDGTMLGHRRLIWTVWVDLATARVAMGWHDGEYRLVAVSETGTGVTLPLREGASRLPREQLSPVANAIMGARCRYPGAVRLFQDRVMAIHDGSAWVETNANPRIALPFKFALASAIPIP